MRSAALPTSSAILGAAPSKTMVGPEASVTGRHGRVGVGGAFLARVLFILGCVVTVTCRLFLLTDDIGPAMPVMSPNLGGMFAVATVAVIAAAFAIKPITGVR